ncbi:MAG: ATP-binding protein [Pseudomonadota bacterium]
MDSYNPNAPLENLSIGTIVEVDGSHIVAELKPGITELSRIFGGDTYPIGQFGSIVKIHFGRRIIYAFVGRLRMKAEYELERGLPPQAASDERIIEADLFGEGEWLRDAAAGAESWELQFDRGVATYPLPQQTVYLTPKRELRFIYGHGKGPSVHLGEHVGTGGTKCYAEMNELLGKHTAILGSTGAGKSGTVAAVLHSLLERGAEERLERWSPRIVVLDPHNEYSAAFPKHKKLSTDEGSLILPFWLMSFSETIALVIGKTEFVATSQANIIKSALLKARSEGATLIGLDATKVTVDSPVPYKLSTFIANVKADMPTQASKQDSHNSILEKIDVLVRDARVSFLMKEWDGAAKDPLPEVLSQLVGDNEQPRIVDLSGVPNEVAGVSSAMIARTLFNMKVWQTADERQCDPVLLVCEEAHRYVPNRGEAQYEAAQDAIRRIAKEGRKYGLGLLLVSQRPSEVEATVLSQCNSWIILRITNDADREHVRAILPDSMAGLTKMLSGLRRQEAIFVGQAAVLPSRILIRSLLPEQLPRSNDIDFNKGWQEPATTQAQLGVIANRWRFQQR